MSKNPRCTCITSGPSIEGPDRDCPVHGKPQQIVHYATQFHWTNLDCCGMTLSKLSAVDELWTNVEKDVTCPRWKQRDVWDRNTIAIRAEVDTAVDRALLGTSFTDPPQYTGIIEQMREQKQERAVEERKKRMGRIPRRRPAFSNACQSKYDSPLGIVQCADLAGHEGLHVHNPHSWDDAHAMAPEDSSNSIQCPSRYRTQLPKYGPSGNGVIRCLGRPGHDGVHRRHPYQWHDEHGICGAAFGTTGVCDLKPGHVPTSDPSGHGMTAQGLLDAWRRRPGNVRTGNGKTFTPVKLCGQPSPDGTYTCERNAGHALTHLANDWFGKQHTWLVETPPCPIDGCIRLTGHADPHLFPPVD